MTIRAVLFDLHGVLTSSPWSALAEVAASPGVDEALALRVILGDYATDGDHPWHRLERGEITVEEYFRLVVAEAEAAGVALDWSRMSGYGERMAINHQVPDRIGRLRAEGYKTALVTNNVREMAGGWRALFDVDALFDIVVDSSSVGMRKPNPAIFLHTLDALGGIAPAEAVFLDDSEGNVAGARAAGLHAILVEDVDAALADLDRLLSGAG